MSNDYYNPTGNPQFGARESSSVIAAEFAAIGDAFNALPASPLMLPNYIADSGAIANAYVIALVPVPAAYVDGMAISFYTTRANTGAATVNVNALGAVALVNAQGSALQANDITNPSLVSAVYKGGSFYMTSGEDRGWIHGETWSGPHDFTGATITVPTAGPGTNTTAAASTAFTNAAVAVETARAEAAESAEATARANADATETARAEAAEAALNTSKAALSGAAFTGAITVQAPTASANPTTKAYVDASIFAGGSAPEWVSGNTYTLGNVVFSPLNLQTYRHSTATSSLTTDPSQDATNWIELGATATYLTYANAANLRTLVGSNAQQATVEGLGIFTFVVGSTEPDDGETCFAAGSGASAGCWLLEGASWDIAFAYWLPEFWYNNNQVATLNSEVATLNSEMLAVNSSALFGTFSMSLTSLAATTATSFTATVTGALVGSSVVVNSNITLPAYICYDAYISAANTVTVTVRNPSATAATLTAGTWNVLVLNSGV